jgi:uncharacterized membrane protein
MRTSFRFARRRSVIGPGWISLAVGAAEVVVPYILARAVGGRVPRRLRGLVPALGARGMSAGIGLLAKAGHGHWLKRRLLGERLDVGFVGRALRRPGARRVRTVGAFVATWGLAIYDARRRFRARREALALAAAPVQRSIIIARPPAEVFAFWRDFANLPGIIPHLDAVDVLDDDRSRWRARGADGDLIEWEAAIVEERDGALVGWRSVDRASIGTAGSLRLEPALGGQGTEVHLELQYDPPDGQLGRIVASFWGEEREEEVEEALRRLKARLEMPAPS